MSVNLGLTRGHGSLLLDLSYFQGGMVTHGCGKRDRAPASWRRHSRKHPIEYGSLRSLLGRALGAARRAAEDSSRSTPCGRGSVSFSLLSVR
jgi:hypothetical protein